MFIKIGLLCFTQTLDLINFMRIHVTNAKLTGIGS